MGLWMKAWQSLVYLSVMLQKYSRGLCLSWGQGIAFFQDSDYVSKGFRKFFFYMKWQPNYILFGKHLQALQEVSLYNSSHKV